MVDEDVDGHKRRVGEEAGVDALVGLVADDVFLDLVGIGVDAESLAGLVFERGGAHELTDADVHVHQQIHLRDLGDVALHVDHVLVGIESGGEIFGQDVFHVLVEHLGVGMSGERVEVGHEITAIVVVLHAHEFIEGTVIVAQMEVARGADAAEHYLFLAVAGGGSLGCGFVHILFMLCYRLAS